MGFYTFNQNNSGGRFVYDERLGLSVYVIVEAHNSVDVLQRAENIGIYFDPGCLIDCECCGSRWSEYDATEATGTPTVYGLSVTDYVAKYPGGWLKNGFDVFIHYLEGRVEGFK